MERNIIDEDNFNPTSAIATGNRTGHNNKAEVSTLI